MQSACDTDGVDSSNERHPNDVGRKSLLTVLNEPGEVCLDMRIILHRTVLPRCGVDHITAEGDNIQVQDATYYVQMRESVRRVRKGEHDARVLALVMS
jgi:hypothetical protein